MVIDLRKDKVTKQNTTTSNKTLSQYKKKPKSQIFSSAKTQGWLYGVIIFYTSVLLIGVIGIYLNDWGSVWQLPKSLLFIGGVMGLLFFTSGIWIFGVVRHKVSLTLLDIGIMLGGLIIGIISLLQPNDTAFWGSTTRIFDSGVFLIYLALFYILLKIFMKPQALLGLTLVYGMGILLSNICSVLIGYFPTMMEQFPLLNKLNPTGSWLTEYPLELGFLSLVSVTIMYGAIIHIQSKRYHILMKILFGIALLTHIALIVRLPVISLYGATLISLIVYSIASIRSLYRMELESRNISLKVIRISFIYAVIGIFLIAIFILRPFENNETIQEYPIAAIPSFSISLNIMKESIQNQGFLGSGTVIYAWDRFSSTSFNQQEIDGFSFDTLVNEPINLIVRYGIVIGIMLGLIVVWLLLSFLRIVLIQKNISIELYGIVLLIFIMIIMPLTVIMKIGLILGLLIWSNIMSRYFKPAYTLLLDITKISAPIASLSTFSFISLIAISVLISIRGVGIIQAQNTIATLTQEDILSDRALDIVEKARLNAPFMIDYAQISISQQINRLNEDAQTIFISQRGSENLDIEKQKTLQDTIVDIQKLIDTYSSQFPDDARVIVWQLDLYSVIDRYGNVEEAEYMKAVNRGKELKPNSFSWVLYEAQYYARQSQKGEELNQDILNKSKAILDTIIEQKKDFAEAYQTYYDILAFAEAYQTQIKILSQYVNTVTTNNQVANKELIYALGLAYQNNRQYDDAIALYTKLLETFPNYTNVYFQLGEIYEANNKIPEAIEQYQKVLELDPQADLVRVRLDQLTP